METLLLKTMAQRALLIINPRSGTRQRESIPGMVEAVMSKHETELMVKVTTCPEDVTVFAREAVDQRFDKVIVAGGDGTVSEVASVLCFTDIPLAILPCGSGNGLSRTLAIPQDFQKAVEVIDRDYQIVIDRGQVNGNPFFCTFGMGFDAMVSKKFATEKRRGRITYIKNAFREFLSYNSEVYAISVDGNVVAERAMLVAVCNASQYGNNAFIAPEASLTDGLLDITIIHDGSLLMHAMAGLQLMSGHIDRNILVDTFRVSQAEISRLKSGPVHIDGEPLEMGKLFKVECNPNALRVVASPNINKPFKPMATPLKLMLQDIGYDIRADFNDLLFNG